MLDIFAIRWRNFLSYGDYETKITGLNAIGPLLITGRVVDPDGVVSSNGAGKSTITVAIVWCLFGRTFNKDRPGDNVVNYYVGRDCYVEIETTDGWIIRRTRKMSGKDDLLVYVNGKDETRSTNKQAQAFIDEKFNLDYNIFTTSTFFGQMSKPILEMADQARKETLERLLGLDLLNRWALNAKDKLKSIESSQEVKRSILNRLKNDVETYRGLVHKNQEECANFENSQQDMIIELEREVASERRFVEDWEKNIGPDLEGHEKNLVRLDKLGEAYQRFGSQISDLEVAISQARIQADAIRVQIGRSQTWRDEYGSVDVSHYRELHRVFQERLVSSKNDKALVEKYRLKKLGFEQEAKREAKEIKEWRERGGQICPHCKQEIDKDHAAGCIKEMYEYTKERLTMAKEMQANIDQIQAKIIEPEEPDISSAELDRIESKLNKIDSSIKNDQEALATEESKIQELQAKIDVLLQKQEKLQAAIDAIDEPMTYEDVEKSRREYQEHLSRIVRLEGEIKVKKAEKNPYDKIVVEMKANLKNAVVELRDVNDELKLMNTKAAHFQYLWRAYFDRNKVKKLLLSTMIPYLNQRIQYYLDCFRCPIKISFKDNLAVESSVWNYDYCSGGERRRIDLSIMFALHDLYLGIHGRQCNIMVLDEVDGRLDGAGIEAFIEIVNNDFTKDNDGRSKPGTVFVISHRAEMVDAFPSKLMVKKDGNSFSHLVA